jgi:anthranilate synthase component 2
MRITLFDNHDSFTWNLAHDLEREGVHVTVVRAGEWSDDLWAQTDALVLSPGPGLPQEHLQLLGIIDEALGHGVPVLGVCLGMQALAVHFGAALRNLDAPLHGRSTEITWSLKGVETAPLASMWEELGSPTHVGHYHSWVVDEASLPADLHVNARNSQGLPMAFLHGTLPVAGVQFHPESVLTPEGQTLLRGWISAAQRCLAISASNVSLNFS